jgi:V/A-type H+-transporting ATPase subunit I
VKLEEKPFFRPFELLMTVYGVPKYGSVDPVPIIALPFAFFFGYCLGDAGYGAVLMLVSLLLPKRVKMGKSGKALFQILFWGGFFAIVVGIPTGSIFGNLTGFGGLVSPLENPADLTTLMIISISIGLLYTGFGYVIGLYNKVRQEDVLGGIFDVLPWALISFSAFYLAMQMLVGGTLSLQSPAIYVILASVLLVVFTHGRSHKGFGKILYGITGVYGIVNILSDALSFIRLFALGLSSYVLAYVFNLLAELSLGIPYLGVVLFAIVLLIGHTFTFIMSGIGAFVHSLRLHYVEFFGKFFESGEKAFRPFECETRFFKRGE